MSKDTKVPSNQHSEPTKRKQHGINNTTITNFNNICLYRCNKRIHRIGKRNIKKQRKTKGKENKMH